MKKFLFIISLSILVSMSTSAQMLVGSYNIRLKVSSDSINGNVWQKRCQVICDQLNFMSPDIFKRISAFYLATAGEYAAIFYKKDRLRLLDQGNFWISETPDRPGLGWDAACVRICTWGKFAGQTATNDDAFYFFNLHMDHVGVVARREGAKLIVRKIREIAQGAPVIVTGDFNVDQNDEIYTIFTNSGLLADSYHKSQLRFAENGTFNSFDTDLYTDSRIDHIFVSPDTEVEAYGVLTNSYWVANEASSTQLKGHDAPQQINFSKYTRRQPSDHYPVFVRLTLKP